MTVKQYFLGLEPAKGLIEFVLISDSIDRSNDGEVNNDGEDCNLGRVAMQLYARDIDVVVYHSRHTDSAIRSLSRQCAP